MSRLRKSFGLKMIYSFVAVILVVLSAFTLFAFVRESKKAKEDLREQGEMLTGLLSRNSIVGVFAENDKLLADAAEGVMGIKNVLAVSIYNTDFMILYARGKTPSEKNAFPLPNDRVNALRRAQSLIVVESLNVFEFLGPIVIKSGLNTDESLYFEHTAEGAAVKTIGYARIVLSKDAYHKELYSVVMRNVVIMLIFIFSSIVIVYFAVKKITRPLDTLTESVKAIERGMRVEQVPVETGDEIGNLASAFNAMIVARGLAEESLKAYHERLVAMSSELSRSEEMERRRIAVDLHDTVGQLLALSKIKLGALREAAPSRGFADSLDSIRLMIDQSIQFTRSLTVELSPPALYELGLEAAIEGLAGQIRHQHGISVTVVRDWDVGKEVSEEMRVLIFKTVRELLFNIVKHADAHTATILISGDASQIRITVEDDGVGFDAVRADIHSARPSGFGLFTIRERLNYLGGKFEVDSAPGRGTRIQITAPYNGLEL